MDLHEAKKLGEIALTVDGGCSCCVRDAVERLNAAFPDFVWDYDPDYCDWDDEDNDQQMLVYAAGDPKPERRPKVEPERSTSSWAPGPARLVIYSASNPAEIFGEIDLASGLSVTAPTGEFTLKFGGEDD